MHPLPPLKWAASSGSMPVQYSALMQFAQVVEKVLRNLLLSIRLFTRLLPQVVCPLGAPSALALMSFMQYQLRARGCS